MFVLNICIIIAKLTVYVAGSCHFLLPLLTLCLSSLCALEHPARSPARVLLAHWSQRAMLLLATRGSAVLHSASRDRQNERQADVTLHFLLFDCKRDELLCTVFPAHSGESAAFVQRSTSIPLETSPTFTK